MTPNTKHQRYGKWIIVSMLILANIGTAALGLTPTANSRFTNYGPESGLSVGRVEAITQDSVGYMWLGGPDGLSRFDGYNFERFQADSTIEGSISSIVVWDFLEDRNKQFWIATDNGLNRYFPDSNTFKTYKFDTALRNAIRDIVEDSQGRLWLGTGDGLVLFDPETEKPTYFEHISRTTNGAAATLMLSLAFDHLERLWIATHRGGVVHYDIDSDTYTRYMPDEKNPEASLQHSDVNALAIGKKTGRIYIGTEKGFSVFDPSTKIWQHFPVMKGSDEAISAIPVLDIFEDMEGNVWIGTDNGLNILNAKTKKITQLFHSKNELNSLLNNSIRAIYQDKNNDFWIGTFPQGVSFFNRSDTAFETIRFDPNNKLGLSSESVLSLMEDESGKLWVSTDGGGITVFDFHKGSTEYYRNLGNTHLPSVKHVPNVITGNAVLDVIEDGGFVWAGTWAQGLNRINRKTGEIKHYLADLNDPTTLQTDNIWTLYIDSKNTLWMGTTGGDGLYRYDRELDRVVPFKRYVQGDPGGLSANVVWVIHEDSAGDLWFGTDKGLDRYNADLGQFTRYRTLEGDLKTLGSSVVLTLHDDKKGRFWVGTRGGGLNLLDKETGIVTRYGKKDGFPSDIIASIEEDDDGNLWLGTYGGLVRFNPETLAVRVYDKRNGLQGDTFNFNTSIKLKNGDFIFGGTQGFTRFNPKNIIDNKYRPPIVYSDFQLLNKSVPVGGDLLKRTINYAEQLTLTHDQSVLTFSFSALNFRNADKNQYAYMLEGFDKTWVEVGNKRSATYTNLDAGNYVFKVKASNDEGVWQEDPKTIGLTILPPWYATWWAYTLYGLIAVALIGWAIQHQRGKRIYAERQNKLLEQRVLERTSEIAAKNKNIQALLQNMKQGIFSIHENGTIHPEYSQFLEEIFETDDIAQQNFISFLFSHSSVEENARNEVQEAVYAMIGCDEVNFTFNAHLLTREYEANINGKTKSFSLDWNPIVERGIIERMMVSVRDVTQLKKVEAESAAQKRELEMVGQLIAVDAHKYLVFESSTRDYISECRESVRSSVDPDKLVKQLFRIMHTIKGNSRTYGFTYLSNAAHEIETTYSSVATLLSTKLDNDTMMDDLIKINGILDEYGGAFRNVLGRGADAGADQRTDIKLTEALDDIVKSLPAIAVQLGKAVPIVNIDSTVVVPVAQLNVVTSVFSHILRNSVDHGLEYPEIRVKKSKPVSGRIDVTPLSSSTELLRIAIQDDGRGLHLNRLRQVAIQRGIIAETDQLTNQQLANLIFTSGLTTKERATDISGRGVGMDAVKSFLENAGGSIDVVLTGEVLDGHVPFELHVSIPRSA